MLKTTHHAANTTSETSTFVLWKSWVHEIAIEAKIDLARVERLDERIARAWQIGETCAGHVETLATFARDVRARRDGATRRPGRGSPRRGQDLPETHQGEMSMDDTPHFRFRLADGREITGPVHGNGGIIRGESARARLELQQKRARAGHAITLYEPAPGCVCVYPEYAAAGNGTPVHVDLRTAEILWDHVVTK